MRVGDIIKQLRKEKKLTQVELAERLGVAPTAVSAWERNENRPLMDKLTRIAEIFDVPVSRFFESEEFGGIQVSEMTRIPIVGRISCGNGVIAFEEIEGYEPVPKEWISGGDHFFLRASGDSMVGARIHDGDLVLIRKQDTVENGEIAAVLIGDEAVLKKVYFQNGTIILQSANEKYPPIISPPAEIRIIGKLKMNVIKFD